MTKASRPELPSRHIPQRTCIACHKTGAKRELVRLVRLSDGTVEIDPTGKRPGRGAYLCPAPPCWHSALGSGKLEYALGARINQENKEKLANYAKAINNTEGTGRS